MLSGEIIAVYFENNKKSTNTLCENTYLLIVIEEI
jgi:hypothetical protein